MLAGKRYFAISVAIRPPSTCAQYRSISVAEFTALRGTLRILPLPFILRVLRCPLQFGHPCFDVFQFSSPAPSPFCMVIEQVGRSVKRLAIGTL
jgi:hypothetical protein